ncbi:MAG: alpha/beta hydrolase [Myxococcales bacterium]|nr:alpha/beta hydrolase [Myxococcales bacterium]
MDYDREGFVTARDGTRLFYGDRGVGEPGRPTLVLCDGVGCDGFAWHYLQPYFAERYRVLHWHYRGHGRSGPPVDRARIGITDLADDLGVLLDALGVHRAVLLGHSMGTQVALERYRNAPDETLALALLCGSYGQVTETFHGSDVLARVLPTVLEQVDRYASVARALWSHVPSGLAYRIARWSGEVDGATIREDDFRRYWDHVSIVDPDVFLRMLHAAGEHSAEALLPEVAAPTLVVSAERDTFTPPALAARLAERVQRGELFVLRGASHAAPVEQPDAVNLRIEKFLDDVLPSSA